MDTAGSNVETGPASSCFPSTQWSQVLEAGNIVSPGAQEALAALCGKYWYPIYAYIRRRGYRPEDAQDLTQEFFTRFLERKYFAIADPGRGRFRALLITSVKHLLADEWDRAQAAKRGAGRSLFSWDAQQAEARYCCEAADDLTPEKLFDQRWAGAVLGEALARLREEYIAAGKAALFDVLKVFLSGIDSSSPRAALAQKLGYTEGALHVAVCRLRARYRALLLHEIAQTVSSGSDAQDEVRHLFAAFA